MLLSDQRLVNRMFVLQAFMTSATPTHINVQPKLEALLKYQSKDYNNENEQELEMRTENNA